MDTPNTRTEELDMHMAVFDPDDTEIFDVIRLNDEVSAELT
jgi:hypothetical protein